MDAYFKSRALSKSAIDLLLECPAHYKAWLDGVEDEKESGALNFGSLFHTLSLEPEKVDSRYAVTDLNLTTKAGRDWKAELQPGVTIVREKEYEQALSMRDAVMEHPQAKHLFKNFTAETPIYWERDGVQCKAKPDLISEVSGLRFIADLKSTESVNPEAIKRSMVKWCYYRQAPWYLDGMEAIGHPCEAFIFIFVEKSYPHLVTMCQLDEASLIKGREDCDRAMNILKECRQTGVYPCYTRDILTLSLPKWAYAGE